MVAIVLREYIQQNGQDLEGLLFYLEKNILDLKNTYTHTHILIPERQTEREKHRCERN